MTAIKVIIKFTLNTDRFDYQSSLTIKLIISH